MFKILNLFRPTPQEIAAESMRDRFERVTGELNDVLSALPEMPVLHIDPANRSLAFVAPDQFADEALALPEPSAEERAASEADTQDDSEQDSTTALEQDQDKESIKPAA